MMAEEMPTKIAKLVPIVKPEVEVEVEVKVAVTEAPPPPAPEVTENPKKLVAKKPMKHAEKVPPAPASEDKKHEGEKEDAVMPKSFKEWTSRCLQ